MKPTLLLILLTFLLASCDVNEPLEFTSEYVVEAYLFAGEPMPELRLSRTVPFGTPYVFEDQAVSNAQVEIRLIDEAGSVEETFDYALSTPGIYLPPDTLTPVQPLGYYELEITVDGTTDVIRSATTVPDSFSIRTVSGDTIVFLSTEQLEVDVTPSFYPGRQTVYIFSTEALEPTLENLTPFYLDILNEDEAEEELEEFRINESPLLNEANYDPNEDGTITIRLPWIAVAFFGPNRISANAVDDNIFDFVSSQTIQTQASTLSPGEVPDVIDPIEGGTGIFGSYARINVDIIVARP